MFTNPISKIKVLIADDHKLIRLGLKNSLEKNGEIEVVQEADNGKDAISKIKNHNIDVAVIDVILEDMSGLEVIKRAGEFTNDTKFIALTSQINEKDVITSIQNGALAYVLKDISSETFSVIVKSVYRGCMWLDWRAVSALKQSKNLIIPQRATSRAKFKASHNNLTEREYEVLKLVVDGKSNLEIANELHISEHTSKAHVCNIIQKLVVDDRTQAAVKALKEGIV